MDYNIFDDIIASLGGFGIGLLLILLQQHIAANKAHRTDKSELIAGELI